MVPAAAGALRWAGHICRLGLALVFLTAGLIKSLDPEALSREAAQYGILPQTLTLPFALILIPLEIVVGAALLLDWRRAVSFSAACGLMALFIAAISFALLADRPLEACGCFGRHVPRTPAQTLTEDLGFFAAGLFGYWALRRGSAEPGRGRSTGTWKGAALAGIAVASAGFTVASPHLPLDNLATALAPGVTWADLGVAVAERDFTKGHHFVAILGLRNEQSGEAIGPLNALAATGEWETTGLYAGDEEALVEFTFMRGPAFPLYQTAPSDLRRLHRRLPRYFALKDGQVMHTWNELPDAAAIAAVLGGSRTAVAREGAR